MFGRLALCVGSARLMLFAGALTLAACFEISDASARSLSELRSAAFGEIGYIRPVRCPIGGRYDCLSFPRNLYQLNGSCFTVGYGSTILGTEEAMVVRFRSGATGLMVKSGFGDRFELVDIEQFYDCPDLY